MYPTVWLVRHAHRLDFIQPEWFDTAPLPYDPPLSALGWQQSLELVPQLRNSGIQQIFTSPYLRTLQTAYPIAQALGLPIQIENGLREWLHPAWSPAWPLTLSIELLADLGLPINLYYQSQVFPKYPETAAELTTRTIQVADQIISQSKKSLLIVAHKHTLMGIVAALISDASVIQQLAFAPAGVMVLTNTGDRASGTWQIAPPELLLKS
jgi:broad specificity phosphatase PhoE